MTSAQRNSAIPELNAHAAAPGPINDDTVAWSTEAFAALVQRISAHFDAGLTAAQLHALAGMPAECDIDALADCLEEVGIDVEPIATVPDIEIAGFEGIGLIVFGDQTWLFAMDDNTAQILFTRLDTGEQRDWRAFRRVQRSEPRLLVRFFARAKEAFAVVPGWETHWFFGPIWKNRHFFTQAGIAALLTNFFAMGVSMFSLVVYNKIIPAQAMSSLAVLVSGMVLLILADYAVKVTRAKFISAAGMDADLQIADRLFAKVMDVQLKARSGQVGTLANVLKEYEQIREFLTSAALVSVIDIPFAILFLVAIGWIGEWMLAPVLIGILLLVIINTWLQPRLKRIAETSFKDGSTKHAVLVEALTGLETVKTLGAGGILRRRFRQVLARQADIAEQGKQYSHLSANLTQEVQQVVQIAVIAVGAVTVTSGSFGFGAIIACTMLASRALLPFAQVSQLLVRINQVITGYKALNQLMQAPSEHDTGDRYLSRGVFKGDITLESVSFRYPGQKGDALKSMSLQIKAGEKVAIVGRVGSGKTTIGKLIAKLYMHDEGSIKIDGVDLQQIDPSALRLQIGYVGQEPWLMAGNVEQNILLGAGSVGTPDLLWASWLAGVDSFVDNHPEGYKMPVRERGDSLSGGQRQAITIARAVIKRPPILILDEPTSAMDARTERAFIERFRQENLQTTMILITHRSSLLQLVDRVILIDDGRCMASKTVAEFLQARHLAAAS